MTLTAKDGLGWKLRRCPQSDREDKQKVWAKFQLRRERTVQVQHQAGAEDGTRRVTGVRAPCNLSQVPVILMRRILPGGFARPFPCRGDGHTSGLSFHALLENSGDFSPFLCIPTTGKLMPSSTSASNDDSMSCPYLRTRAGSVLASEPWIVIRSAEMGGTTLGYDRFSGRASPNQHASFSFGEPRMMDDSPSSSGTEGSTQVPPRLFPISSIPEGPEL